MLQPNKQITLDATLHAGPMKYSLSQRCRWSGSQPNGRLWSTMADIKILFAILDGVQKVVGNWVSQSIILTILVKIALMVLK